MRYVAPILALILATTRAHGGTVRVEQSINGGAFALHSNWTTVGGTVDITINGVSIGNDLVVFRVRDVDAGPPDDSVGSITINGTIGSGEVRLFIGSGVSDNPTATYPADEQDLLLEGLRNLGTTNNPAIIFGSSDLAARSRVAIAVNGDVLGNITAGRITRVQALGRTVSGTLLGGTISGHISSTLRDEATTWQTPNAPLAIGVITAAKSISGDITAQTPAEFNATDPYSNTASIDSIIIGPFAADNATGISLTGDISAPAGKIQSILTAGPIQQHPSRTRRPRFTAGNGIWELATVPTSTGLARDVDFAVDLTANTIEGERFASNPEPDALRKPILEQNIRRLVTAGDFTGDITCENMTAPVYVPPQGAGSGGWWGVFVGGTFTGKINVRDRVLSASIVAANFVDPDPQPGVAMISIGTYLKGSIVATSPTGEIPSISVGRDSLAGVNGDSFEGFTASINPPSPLDDDPTGVDWLNTSGYQEPDAMIRAHSIGSLSISKMNYGNSKVYAPRIESPNIGSIQVDEMTCGIVWSGLREQPENNYDNDFASVGSINLGCVTIADLWVESDSIVATGNFSGRVHLPTLGADGLIKLGQFWNSAQQLCTSAQEPGGTTELSPRNAQLSANYNNGAGIRIAQSAGLAGQIILGTTAADAWSSTASMSVYVGSPDPVTPTELARYSPFGFASPQPRLAPYYEQTSATLGGGAIGEVPFGLHPIDSIPDVLPAPGAPFAYRGLESGEMPLHLSHYGPVKFGTEGAPLLIEHFNDGTQSWDDMTSKFDFALSTNKRDLILTAQGETLDAGQYRISPAELFCDLGDTSEVAVAPYPMDGYFYFFATCALPDGSPNPADIAAVGGTIENPGEPDGQLTSDDLVVFVGLFSESPGCPGTTPCNRADVASVGGFPPSDGELTVDDLIVFINSFSAGCRDE